jgi:hypothetical protein
MQQQFADPVHEMATVRALRKMLAELHSTQPHNTYI